MIRTRAKCPHNASAKLAFFLHYANFYVTLPYLLYIIKAKYQTYGMQITLTWYCRDEKSAVPLQRENEE